MPASHSLRWHFCQNINDLEKINLINSMFNLVFLLTGGGLVLIFFAILSLYHPYFGCSRAIKLLNKIMLSNGEVEIDEIKRKWFNKSEKIEHDNSNWDFISRIEAKNVIYLGILISILGLILYFILNNSLGVSIVSISIAIISVGLGVHAIRIGRDSDEKMKIIEVMNFNRLRGLLRERRLSLRGKMLGLKRAVLLEIKSKKIIQEPILIRLINEFEIYYCFSIWQSLVYLRQIDRLKDRLSKKEKKLILHIIRNLFSDLTEGLEFLRAYFKIDYNLNGNYPGQIESIFTIIKNFGVHIEEKQQYNDIVLFKKSLLEKIKVIIQKSPEKTKQLPKRKGKK